MNELTKRMRHRRFKLKKDAPVDLLIETMTGNRLKLRLDNVSLNGIGAISEEPLSSEDGFEPDCIIPATKITFKDHEYALGRSVVRTIKCHDGKTFVGLSTIDAKLPIDSALSIFIDGDFDSINNPFEFELSPDTFSMANFTDGTQPGADLFTKAKKFSVFLKDWRKSAKYSYENVRLPSMGARVRLNRKRRDARDDFIVMGSNDYLGLSSHPEVLEAAKKAIDEYGFGSTGAPVATGITAIHEELSLYLAKLFKKEKVLLFNSGYTANIGIINGLLHSQDLVVADVISHASINDAMQMSRATSRFFKHNNTAHLETILNENRESHLGSLVVTEGVFSMDGDVPPLDKIVSVAKKHKSRVMIDEAHSFGVIGQTGLGAAEKFGVLDDVDLIMGTFSKVCGGIGGFVATTEEVADWLHFWARAHMFTVSIPPSTAAACLKAVQLLAEDKSHIARLRENIIHFTKGLRTLGYQLPADHESSVIPVVIGDEKKLEAMNKVLMDAGVYVIPVTYPVVSRHKSRFRFTVMANHSISDLDYVLNVLDLALQKADFSFNKDDGGGQSSAA